MAADNDGLAIARLALNSDFNCDYHFKRNMSAASGFVKHFSGGHG
jgi:hypothetical protein